MPESDDDVHIVENDSVCDELLRPVAIGEPLKNRFMSVRDDGPHCPVVVRDGPLRSNYCPVVLSRRLLV